MREADVTAAERTASRRPASKRSGLMARLTHFDAQGKAAMVMFRPRRNRTRSHGQGLRHHAARNPRPDRAGEMKKGDCPGRGAIGRDHGPPNARRTSFALPSPGAHGHPPWILPSTANRNAVDIEATCKLVGRTGVEMEALTAVSGRALTVYDMCKAVDRAMIITDIA